MGIGRRVSRSKQLQVSYLNCSVLFTDPENLDSSHAGVSFNKADLRAVLGVGITTWNSDLALLRKIEEWPKFFKDGNASGALHPAFNKVSISTINHALGSEHETSTFIADKLAAWKKRQQAGEKKAVFKGKSQRAQKLEKAKGRKRAGKRADDSDAIDEDEEPKRKKAKPSRKQRVESE